MYTNLNESSDDNVILNNNHKNHNNINSSGDKISLLKSSNDGYEEYNDDHNVPDESDDIRMKSVTLDFGHSNTTSSSTTTTTTTQGVYHRHVKPEQLHHVLESSRVDEQVMKSSSKKSRKFYEKQNELIDQILEPIEIKQDQDEEIEDFKVKVAINGSLLVNIVLFCLQITAAILTGSKALIATSVDAFMDLLSGFILFMTARYRKKKNFFLYPTGKSRMEPIGILIFSALMSTVSLNLLYEGASTLIKQDSDFSLDTMSILFVAFAIACKVVMFIYCRQLTHSSSAMILATDHRNDITVNSFGIGMAILGNYVRWWLDPVGALIVALIILRSWISEAYEQFGLLVGKSASPEFLQKLTYLALTHHPEVLQVDTCRAFHVGNNLYVEIDIVLPPSMPLVKTHDIGESLQEKIESLSEVDRAFVHVDYEYRHKPEHKKVH